MMFAGFGHANCPSGLALVLAFLLGSPALAAAQTTDPASLPSKAAQGTEGITYQVKRSDVVIPHDVSPGQYRRVTQPFPNWTLICDENLARKQKVCNISQTIIDSRGEVSFSWSLAASDDGRPFFILRTPPSVGDKGVITLDLPDKGAEVSVAVDGCNPVVCIAYQQVGPRLRTLISKGGAVGISIKATDGTGKVSFLAPLDGLNAALAAI